MEEFLLEKPIVAHQYNAVPSYNAERMVNCFVHRIAHVFWEGRMKAILLHIVPLMSLILGCFSTIYIWFFTNVFFPPGFLCRILSISLSALPCCVSRSVWFDYTNTTL